MTAEPVARVRWSPHPMRQRPADYPVEDVLNLPRTSPVADRHFSDPAQVVIAVEVVSPGTRKRDRLQKPVSEITP
jgi:Uma2 family endonuclease